MTFNFVFNVSLKSTKLYIFICKQNVWTDFLQILTVLQPFEILHSQQRSVGILYILSQANK